MDGNNVTCQCQDGHAGQFCEKATDESISGKYRHFDMRPMRSFDMRPMSGTKLQMTEDEDDKQNSGKY